MNYITDKEIDAIQGDMGETLRKQPRVRMRIEGSGYWEGGINGWFFRERRQSCPSPLRSLYKEASRWR